MPAKPPFSEPQFRVLLETAKRIRKRFKNQDQMALALGIAQPSLSALLKGKWKPGVTTAKAIAQLDQRTLEDLIGPYGESAEPKSARRTSSSSAFPNLETCVEFHSGSKHWSAWTIAAARAGFWGSRDVAPPEWSAKLDTLEKALEKIQKGS